MAGIYLHFPFCKSRCVYCDFYSTLRTEKQAAYVRALAKELRLRAGYLRPDGMRPRVDTVYLGGGTPSSLDTSLLGRIFDTLHATYDLAPGAEITLEANPDDLSRQKLRELRTLPVNRLSIGIQTFRDDLLRLLRRRHDGQQAIRAVAECQDAGFDNLSVDLIYGLPGQTLANWESDLHTATSLNATHISAYSLTYEEGTPLWEMRQRQLVEEADEELSLAMFDMLMDHLAAEGFEHYEISNFARPGFRSRHNSSYWQGIPYLGCGPSAHSYDGRDRQWNRPDLEAYIVGMERCTEAADLADAPWVEKEMLSKEERYNDRVITSLRTAEGLDLARLEADFGETLADYCMAAATPHLRTGLLELAAQKKQAGGLLRLTRRGLFLSDGVMSDLLYVAY